MICDNEGLDGCINVKGKRKMCSLGKNYKNVSERLTLIKILRTGVLAFIIWQEELKYIKCSQQNMYIV